jgi:hypothetical protein
VDDAVPAPVVGVDDAVPAPVVGVDDAVLAPVVGVDDDDDDAGGGDRDDVDHPRVAAPVGVAARAQTAIDHDTVVDTREASTAEAPTAVPEDQAVVSTAGPDAVAMVAALDGLDQDIARAIAGAVVDKLAHLVAPAMLPIVADELARALAARTSVADAQPANGAHAP